MPLNVELAEIRDFLAAHVPFDSLPGAVLESVPPRLSIGYHRRGSVVLADAVIKRPLKRGDIIGMDDVELPDSLALRAWKDIERSVLNGRSGEAEKKSALAS